MCDEDGVAGDDEQVAEARQLGDDVLGQPVGEELLLRVAAHVGEGQHGDRGLGGRRRSAAGRLGLPARASFSSTTRKTRIGRAMFLTLCSPRSSKPTSSRSPTWSRTAAETADAARLRQRLQPRRDVHAVAENVAVLDDHVAEIDADAELDAARGETSALRRAMRRWISAAH